MLVYSKRMLEIILENIVTAPERLGLPVVYAESDVLLYRQYGRYDTVAVHREGRQLLKRVEALQAEYDIAALPRLGKQYAEWSKKLQQGHLALAQAFLQTPEEARTCIPYYPYAGVRGMCALHVSSPQAAVRAYSELWQLSLTSWQQAYARIKEL